MLEHNFQIFFGKQQTRLVDQQIVNFFYSKLYYLINIEVYKIFTSTLNHFFEMFNISMFTFHIQKCLSWVI